MDKDRTGLFAPEKESSMAGMFVFYETFASKMSTQQYRRTESHLILSLFLQKQYLYLLVGLIVVTLRLFISTCSSDFLNKTARWKRKTTLVLLLPLNKNILNTERHKILHFSSLYLPISMQNKKVAIQYKYNILGRKQ